MWVDATWISQELGTQEVLQNPMPWRPKRGSIIWNKSSEDLDRPPLLVIDAPPYDEDDPEVSQKVLDWQMSFDASTADKLIVSRCATPSMKASLARHQALRGARILGCDPGLQRSLGIGILNLDSKTGTELHDEWRWQRSDMGLAFGQMSGRYSAPSTTRVHSSLRRPKSEVTFSFKRLARPGFTSGVKIPVGFSSHCSSTTWRCWTSG